MKQGHQQQRYRVLDRLASGGMAEVFLAESAGIEGFKKRVAIKKVLPHLSEKKRFIAMFLDEARLSANLTHSNVAQVFDIGVGDNAYFIVMEYVDGSDLKAVIEYLRKMKRPFPVEVAVYMAEKICDGLAYAHEAKNPEGQPLRIVHRDVSPANVLITKYGEIKIVDFGLAKATSQLEKSEPGIVKGKFGYLSPEATQGLEVDVRTDVFAVGIILWEILAQKRLFHGDNDLQTVMRVREAVVPPLAQLNKDVPPELEKIIHRALARDPEKRYPSARELGRALNGFLFKFGRPVGAHDVAELVSGTVALRKTTDQEKDTTLHKLIEAALLEFNSLQDDPRPGAPREKSKPEISAAAPPPEERPRGRVSHFEDIGKWAEEMDLAPLSGEGRASRVGPVSARSEREPESKPVPSKPAESTAAESTEAENKAAESTEAENKAVESTAAEKKGAESLPTESLPAATVKATPQAKAEESAPVESLKAESLPAETVKATPQAKADEGAVISEPAETVKETPQAKAEESSIESAPVATRTPSPKQEKDVAGKSGKAAKAGAKGKKGAAAKLSKESTAAVAKKAPLAKPAPAANSNVMWLYVAAAVLLLAASAYYGGLFGP
ncbi:serine/threonine protein kinase [Polyangium jinanense]|uniref:Protein kinase n=1 Tax=Polyangium jinanense TaxID=2829994 RepID=A0A9X3X387_9BACT|nr:serine/threonine-protein kinase [Polyangium jinanense]MDC3958241.1 protein kinase [Polyangium jinanense]MDC3983424.1 protein kinase [Polyangium jinanense]